MNAASVDLLEKGKTSGQTVRRLFTPHQRYMEEKEAEDTQDEAASQGKGQSESGSGQDKEEGHMTDEPDQLDEMEERFKMKRGWYNMVCYGLPNLMVTQLSKT